MKLCYSTLAIALAMVTAPQMALASDASAGAVQFKQKCQMCHVSAAGQKPTLAPSLAGVVGRKAGASGYAGTSPALKAYGKPWTPALLQQWLAAPRTLVPGSKMVVAVSTPKDREDIVAYLATLK